MKRGLLALGLVLLAVGTTPVESQADSGHQRPTITVMRWADPPVTADDPSCQANDSCHDEWLIVRAHDPDSSITEVQVWFDENGGRAPFVYAGTYCVQGREPGQPARLRIPGNYTEPGEYTVAAVAYSHKRCLPHEAGDGHPALHSRVMRLVTTVE